MTDPITDEHPPDRYEKQPPDYKGWFGLLMVPVLLLILVLMILSALVGIIFLLFITGWLT